MTRDRIAVSPHDALSTSVPGTTPRRVLRAIGAGPLNFEQRIQAAVAGGVLPVVGARTKEQMVGHIDGTALTLDDEQIAWLNAATSIELGVPDEMSSNPTELTIIAGVGSTRSTNVRAPWPDSESRA
jgi:hypothetical protein